MQNSIQFESGFYQISVTTWKYLLSHQWWTEFSGHPWFYYLLWCLILVLYFSADCLYFCACVYLEQWGLLDACLSPGDLTQAGHIPLVIMEFCVGVSGYQTPLTVSPCLRGHEHLWLILQRMWVMHAACRTSANCKPVKSSLAPEYSVH